MMPLRWSSKEKNFWVLEDFGCRTKYLKECKSLKMIHEKRPLLDWFMWGMEIACDGAFYSNQASWVLVRSIGYCFLFRGTNQSGKSITAMTNDARIIGKLGSFLLTLKKWMMGPNMINTFIFFWVREFWAIPLWLRNFFQNQIANEFWMFFKNLPKSHWLSAMLKLCKWNLWRTDHGTADPIFFGKAHAKELRQTVLNKQRRLLKSN